MKTTFYVQADRDKVEALRKKLNKSGKCKDYYAKDLGLNLPEIFTVTAGNGSVGKLHSRLENSGTVIFYSTDSATFGGIVRTGALREDCKRPRLKSNGMTGQTPVIGFR